MSSTKINFKSLIVEAILIVFTVSLALAMNEWRKNLATTKLVTRVLQTMEDETISNKMSVTKAIEYHKILLNELRSGTHVWARFPLSTVPFKPEDDRLMTQFLENSMLEGLGNFPRVSIYRTEEKRYLIISDRVNEIVIERDSMTIYGKGNIQLKSADIRNNTWQLATATDAILEMDYELVTVLGEVTSIFNDYNRTIEKALTILYGDDGSIQSVLEDMYGMEVDLLDKYNQILEKMPQVND